MTTKKSGLADYRPATAVSTTVDKEPAKPKADTDEKPITVKVGRAGKKQLKDLANHEDTTLQDLGVEGFNLVLKARGLPPLG